MIIWMKMQFIASDIICSRGQKRRGDKHYQIDRRHIGKINDL